MIFHVTMASVIASIIMLVWFAAGSNPCRLLVAYSSISTRLIVCIVFIELVTQVDFISEVALLFLLMNTCGTIIAARYVGGNA